jgi:uncharacterized protein
MYVNLVELSLRGGQHYERNVPVEMEPVRLGGASFQVSLPEGVSLEVDRVAGGYLVKVSLEARVYGPCLRCLKETRLDIHAEQQEFAPTTTEAWDRSELSQFITDLVVDVDALAREALVLALPFQPLCDQACKGLCPQCGADLNLEVCHCHAEEVDPRWAVLRRLKWRED